MGECSAFQYCTWCFAEIPLDAQVCPDCGTDLDDYARHTPYSDRLLHALHHPLSETRMGAVIALGKQADPLAIGALTDCAMDNRGDVIEGLEILRSLAKMPAVPALQQCLQRLARHHPAHAVRTKAAEMSKQLGPSPARRALASRPIPVGFLLSKTAIALLIAAVCSAPDATGAKDC